MKKTFRKKVFVTMIVFMLLVLVAFSMAALKLKELTPCENEPDHFIDE